MRQRLKKLYMLVLLLVAGSAIPTFADVDNPGDYVVFKDQKLTPTRNFIEFEYADWQDKGHDDAIKDVEIYVEIKKKGRFLLGKMYRCHDELQLSNTEYGVLRVWDTSMGNGNKDEHGNTWVRTVKMRYYPSSEAFPNISGMHFYARWDIDDDGDNGDDHNIEIHQHFTWVNFFEGMSSISSTSYDRPTPNTISYSVTASSGPTGGFEQRILFHPGGSRNMGSSNSLSGTLDGTYDCFREEDISAQIYWRKVSSVKNGSYGSKGNEYNDVEQIFWGNVARSTMNALPNPGSGTASINPETFKTTLSWSITNGSTSVIPLTVYRRPDGTEVSSRERIGQVNSNARSFTDPSLPEDPDKEYMYELVYENSSWNESAGSETIRLIFSVPSVSSLWEGAGTQGTPYLIKNEADLRRLAKYTSVYSDNTVGKYWKQTADIDLGGDARPWTPIGDDKAIFKGNYNGGGFTVSNMSVAINDYDRGFFGYASGYNLPEVPVLENIRLKAATLKGENYNYVGVLAGSANAIIIRNCYAEGAISGKVSSVGGLVGRAWTTTFENCGFVGTVSANSVGGFANSYDSGNKYTNCYAAATVTATGADCIGAFDGGLRKGTYTNCFYDSTLAGSMKGVGAEGSTQSSDAEGLAPKATEDFARGQVAWLLNGSKAENPTWYQTLGTDTYPLLDKTHKVVSEWGEGYYSNDPMPWEGEGTAIAPYLISNEAQLRALAVYANNGGNTGGRFWKQTADIDLGGQERPWTPIGTDKIKFSGNYNGGGFTVSNMYVSASGDAGFFGITSAYGLPERQIFENIILKNVNISNSGTYSAGLAARTDETKVQNCYVTGTVAGQMLTGGFIGDLTYTTVYNCGFDGTVSGTDYVGGFAVSGFSSLIMSSYASAAVSGTGTKYIGAFYSKQDGMFDNCYYNSTVAGNVKGAGFDNTTESADVNNITPKTAEEFASGEVTWLLNGSKAENPAWYQTLGTDNLPLLDATHKAVCEWSEGYYSNDPMPWEGEGTSYAPYLISNEAQLRALAAYTNGGGKTAGKFWEQTADIDLGGEARPWIPIGLSSYGMEKFSFNGSYNGGGFTVKNIYLATSSANSGFFGHISGLKLPEQEQPVIENIRLYNVKVSSTDYITGTLTGYAGYSTIRGCYAEGTASGIYAVGGLAGMLGCVTLENCGFAGTAIGERSVGGLVGTFDKTSNVSNCYAAATIAVNPSPTGLEYIGAFCGDKTGTFTNCYYDSILNGAMKGVGLNGSSESNDIEGITPKTTEQFKSGEVTWLLNGSKAETPTWYQTLGEDTYPLLDATHKVVDFWGNGYHNDPFPWTEGDGTKEAPYIISNEAQLRALAVWTTDGAETAGKFWKQTADIDLGGEARPWTSIGKRYVSFKGNYNGGGFTVSNMYANGRDGHLGFFSSVSGYQLPEKPVIENIRLKGATVLADSHYAGTLAGTLNIAVVRNCYAEGNVSGDSYVGGLAGNLSESTFENCGFAGTVSGKDYVGGFGFGNGGFNIFTNCYAAATVNATDPLYIGAFSGYELGTFTNCYYDSTLAGTLKGVGVEGSTEGKDIAGVTPKTTDEFKSGEVTWLLNGSQSETPTWYQTLGEDAYPLLDATHKVILFWGNGYHNDPFPWQGEGTKEVPYLISNEAQLRALAVWTNDGGETAGKFWKQTADIDLGGEARPWTPIGTNEIKFKGSYNGGGFTVSNMHINASFYAGLFGSMDGAELPEQPVIENIRLKSASVKGKDVYYVGALVGDAYEVTIRNCYVEGTVSGHEAIGGLAGSFLCVTIENCCFTGTVDGSTNTGGLIGEANLTNNITGCYAAATVSAQDQSGCFVGFPGGSVFTNCYYDSSLSTGLEAGMWGAVEGVTPKTTDEFKSGEVTWLLNGSQSETPTWYQTLGEDAYPLLDATHKVVRKWMDGTYSNDEYLVPNWQGEGTAESPYLIQNLEDLKYLEKFVGKMPTAGIYWKQTADIDMSSLENNWKDIGKYKHPFSGNYNGGGFRITNLLSDGRSGDTTLFEDVIGTPEQPVVLENIYICNEREAFMNPGLALEASNVIVRNCYIVGNVNDPEYSEFGGFIDIMTDAVIENCAFSGSINVGYLVGGFAGIIRGNVTFKNCYVSASVTAASLEESGIFAGDMSEAVVTVENCWYDSTKANGTKAFGNVDGGTDLGVQSKPALEGTALAAELGIANWNFTAGVLPVQKIFEPENIYDITFNDNFNHDDITADIAGATVRVKKSETETWATVQLPFALTESQLAGWGTFYEFAGYDAVSNKAKFKEVTSVVPHACYLWKRTANSEYWDAEGVTVKRTDRIEVIEPMAAMPEGLVGTDYYKIRVGENNDYQLRDIFTGNVEDCHFAPYASLDERAFPFSAVLYIMGEPKDRIEIELTDRNGITTGIMQVEIDYSNGTYEIYDLYGRRLPKPVQGFNIINGQKVYIK